MGTTLRLPYSFTMKDTGAISAFASSDGTLSNDVVSDGVLTSVVESLGTLSTEPSSQGILILSIYNPLTNDTLYAGSGNMADIYAYVGDYGYDLQFSILDADGNPFNLTAAVVKFQTATNNGIVLKTDGLCVLDVDPTTGNCTYTTVAADFDTAGSYDAQLFILVGGKSYRIGGMTLIVQRKVPRGL